MMDGRFPVEIEANAMARSQRSCFRASFFVAGEMVCSPSSRATASILWKLVFIRYCEER